MRIAQKILLGLAMMVFLVVASSVYTYVATTRLTGVVERLLQYELPAISRLDQLQNLISVLHALETRVLSDNRPEDHEEFEATSQKTLVLIGQIQPLPNLPESAALAQQFKVDARQLVEDEQQAIRLADADDLFDARQMATTGLSERLQVMREGTELQTLCKTFMETRELDNLELSEALRNVAIGFALVSVVLAIAIHLVGVRWFVAPLQRLVRVANEVTHGHLESTAPEDGKDEFGQVGTAFNQMVGNLRSRIEEVAERQRVMQMQLRLSQNVQRGLVPMQPTARGLDLAGRVQPAQRIGGDFYDVLPLERGVGLVVGDASGHGIPAALMMVMAVILMREASRQTSNPAEVFARVNRSLREQFQEEMVEMFLTAAYVVIDVEAGRLTYALAGHEPPFVYRAGDGHVDELDSGDVLLALIDDATYRSTECALFPGDKLVLFTDGVTESRNPDGELYGRERLEQLVRDQGHLPAEQLLAEIFAQVDAFRGDPAAVDDVTVLIASVTLQETEGPP
ncbi:MAG TPA: SpoIIE family protein phosphatase [Candidatus Xenobia bacterium]|jgi:serine phosphatase RsbU (regulator of sigma subunit)